MTHNIVRKTISACRRFRADQSGTASIEMLIWVPIFAVILAFIADTSFLFYGKSKLLQTVQDGNRALSVGRFQDTETTQAYISDALLAYSSDPNVTTTIDAGIIKTVASVPASDLIAVGGIPQLASFRIEIAAYHFLEQ